MDLAAVPWQTTRHAGILVHFYASDRRSGRTLALIRMERGSGYPRHRHCGDERLLVVQGGYRDEHGDYRAGDFVLYGPGTEHSPVAIDGPGEPACVLLALAQEGIALLGD